jgi:hypothetical protein
VWTEVFRDRTVPHRMPSLVLAGRECQSATEAFSVVGAPCSSAEMNFLLCQAHSAGLPIGVRSTVATRGQATGQALHPRYGSDWMGHR